jgi:hypothetical protein
MLASKFCRDRRAAASSTTTSVASVSAAEWTWNRGWGMLIVRGDGPGEVFNPVI